MHITYMLTSNKYFNLAIYDSLTISVSLETAELLKTALIAKINTAKTTVVNLKPLDGDLFIFLSVTYYFY